MVGLVGQPQHNRTVWGIKGLRLLAATSLNGNGEERERKNGRFDKPCGSNNHESEQQEQNPESEQFNQNNTMQQHGLING